MANIPADEPATHAVHVAVVAPTPTKNHHGVWLYITTRVSTLAPPMNKVPNPFSALILLNTQQWLFFLVSINDCDISFPLQLLGWRSKNVSMLVSAETNGVLLFFCDMIDCFPRLDL